MRVFFFVFIVSILLYSCSSEPVKVVVDFEKIDSLKKGIIIFDDKDTLNLEDTAVNIMLLPGKHSFKLNGSAAKEIKVGDKGGILNLDNKEYIAFEIEYAPPKEDDLYRGMRYKSARESAILLIDSLIISTVTNKRS
jgi:hypothetical protein